MSKRRIVIVEAPSSLGLTSDGVELMPETLMNLGLGQLIDAKDHVRVARPQGDGRVDHDTGVLNAHAIASWSPRLADAVCEVLDANGFPLILGGDCTIILGAMLALRRRGRYGLLYIDGNADYFQPAAEPNGEGASMDLAFVTGNGPDLLTVFERYRPLVRPLDTVAFGYRDHDDQQNAGSQPLPEDLLAIDIHRIRELGAARAAHLAVEHLRRAGVAGFLIHLDVDVLDDEIMPAVDFSLPGGLTARELGLVLQIALASDLACGLEVTIYNPNLDSDRAAGRLLTTILAEALHSAPFDLNAVT